MSAYKFLLSLAFVLIGLRASADSVCFYEDINYGGASFCRAPGAADPGLASSGWARRISSVSIEGNSVVQLFSSGSYGGRGIQLNVSHPDLRTSNFNDIAESYKTSVPAGRVCFFENENFSGKVLCMDAGTEYHDLTGIGWNDKISSIQVFGDASAYVWEDSNFSGRKLWIQHSSPSVNAVFQGMNDQISSIRVVHASGQ